MSEPNPSLEFSRVQYLIALLLQEQRRTNELLQQLVESQMPREVKSFFE